MKKFVILIQNVLELVEADNPMVSLGQRSLEKKTTNLLVSRNGNSLSSNRAKSFFCREIVEEPYFIVVKVRFIFTSN